VRGQRTDTRVGLRIEWHELQWLPLGGGGELICRVVWQDMHLSALWANGPDTRVGVEVSGLVSVGITKGSCLNKADEREKQGKGGLGQHTEDGRDGREVVVVRSKKTSKRAPGLISKRK